MRAPSPTSHRLLLAVLPATILLIIGASALWGDSGLFVREALRAKLAASNEELAALERENQRLVRELKVLEEDPVALERIIAEDLGWASQGATIYRFHPPEQNATTQAASQPK